MIIIPAWIVLLQITPIFSLGSIVWSTHRRLASVDPSSDSKRINNRRFLRRRPSFDEDGESWTLRSRRSCSDPLKLEVGCWRLISSILYNTTDPSIDTTNHTTSSTANYDWDNDLDRSESSEKAKLKKEELDLDSESLYAASSAPSFSPTSSTIESNNDELETNTQGSSYPNDDIAFKEFLEKEEQLIRKKEEQVAEEVGALAVLLCIILMICTAYQMSENPDGVCASLCRMTFRVSGYVVQVILYPCKLVFGRKFDGYAHHLVATQEYGDASIGPFQIS